ncbi:MULTISPECIES: bacteriocin-like protein [Chryseobacterium]|uniref:bacteriocin-like protein n=1 Tax=Chryseobacterium TaxID=59732 RepID=UPI001295EEC6|nr:MULTISPECIES: hypothetical protein [Chryseobacterium]MDR6923160.1 hypothetical protein [Chryseobacterium sp. 2987]
MKNLKKVSRENLKMIIGGDSTPISDGLGGWRCSSSFEIVCYKGCTPMCMSFTKCMISFCHDPI